MTAIGRSRIFLAHRAFSAPGYSGNLSRLRLIERGLQSVCPDTLFVRALGRTPDDDPLIGRPPSYDCLQQLALRLIAGDGREERMVLPTSCLPPAAEVWLVSDPDEQVEAQLAAAEECGARITRMEKAEQEANAMLGALVAVRRPAPAVDDPRREVARCPFTSPEEVVRTYWGGATVLLDGRAIPLEPDRVSWSVRKLRDMAESVGLLVAAANGIIRDVQQAPGWSQHKQRVLELRGRDGLSLEELAETLGYPDTLAALRCWQSIMADIAAVLQARRRLVA